MLWQDLLEPQQGVCYRPTPNWMTPTPHHRITGVEPLTHHAWFEGVLGGAVAAFAVGGAVVGGAIGGIGVRSAYGATSARALKSLEQVEQEVTCAEERAARSLQNGVVVVVFENERQGSDGAWSHENMTNRPRWTDDGGGLVEARDDLLAGEGWKWSEPWRIERERVQPDSSVVNIEDVHGWEYARNWPESRWREGHGYGPQVVSSIYGCSSLVRRRAWVRTKVPTISMDASAMSQASGGGYLEASEQLLGGEGSLLGLEEDANLTEVQKNQARTLKSIAAVAELSRAVNLRLLQDQGYITNSSDMLRFQEKLGEASDRVLQISLWNSRGGDLGVLEHGDRPQARENAVGEREALGEDVFDAMSTMLRDINKTHAAIGDVTADQIEMLQQLAQDVERGHHRMKALTHKIQQQLR